MKKTQEIDINSTRKDFPALNQQVYGNDLVYLDNAATTHKPSVVMDKIVEFYSTINSNIHRGAHYLSKEASISYEETRVKVKNFINASSTKEIIFTKGTTDSINLLASSFGRKFIKKGDEIITTVMEHHSNILPWKRLCENTGASLKVLPIDSGGALKPEGLKSLINEKTKLIVFTHVSNVLGCVNPVKELTKVARSEDIPVLVDGAQAVGHISVDVKDIDCDFYAFSGHKMYGGTGIGVLYGKKKWLDAMEPYQIGGGMVTSVSFKKITYEQTPLKFEAGTNNIAGALSLGEAIEYIDKIGFENISIYESGLLNYALKKLKSIEDIMIYGESDEKCGVISFNLKNIHPEDTAAVLDKLGIAVRAGTHCAQPLMNHYRIPGTVRASFAFYNTKQEIDKLTEGIKRARLMLRNE